MMTTRYTGREAIRLAGMRLLSAGRGVMDVARTLGVAQSTVSGWKARLDADGPDAVRDKPRSGRPTKLAGEQRRQLLEMLEQGALAHGFRSDLWTLPRVKTLIEDRFGVRYHVSYLGELLRRLGFTPQKPARRARQQDPEQVERFRRRRWPAIRKKVRKTKR